MFNFESICEDKAFTLNIQDWSQPAIKVKSLLCILESDNELQSIVSYNLQVAKHKDPSYFNDMVST